MHSEEPGRRPVCAFQLRSNMRVVQVLKAVNLVRYVGIAEELSPRVDYKMWS